MIHFRASGVRRPPSHGNAFGDSFTLRIVVDSGMMTPCGLGVYLIESLGVVR